jgi:hypothetical protein
MSSTGKSNTSQNIRDTNNDLAEGEKIREQGAAMKTANSIVMKTPDLTEESYHEAGKAVVACELGLLRKKDNVTVPPDGRSLWCFSDHPSEDVRLFDRLLSGGRLRMEQVAVFCLAGKAAQSRYLRAQGKTFLGGAEDRRRAVALLKLAAFFPEEEVGAYYAFVEKRAEVLIAHDWALVVAVAKRLVTDRTLTDEQIRETCHIARGKGRA